MAGSSSMALDQPVVATNISLPDLLEHVLWHHGTPTWLVICSTKEAFLHQVLQPISHGIHEDSTQDPIKCAASEKRHHLLTRTLSVLSASRTVRCAFCPSVPALHAFLITLPRANVVPAGTHGASSRSERALLCLINPLALHNTTSHFSAQSLSRTFALAVEAAYRGQQRLMVYECPGSTKIQEDEAMEDEGESSTLPPRSEELDTSDIDSNFGGNEQGGMADPWKEQIPILNATTKMYGGTSSRDLFDRTVTAASIASRWCTFQDLSSIE